MNQSKKVYFISGEASGDLHGSNLIKELLAQKNKDVDIDIRFWGGCGSDQLGLGRWAFGLLWGSPSPSAIFVSHCRASVMSGIIGFEDQPLVGCDDQPDELQELQEEEALAGQGMRRSRRRRKHGKKQAEQEQLSRLWKEAARQEKLNEPMQDSRSMRFMRFADSGDGTVWTAVPLAVGPLPFTATPCRNVVTWKDLGGDGVLNARAGANPPRACKAVTTPTGGTADMPTGGKADAHWRQGCDNAHGARACSGSLLEAGARRSPAIAAAVPMQCPSAMPGAVSQQQTPTMKTNSPPKEWTSEHSDMMRRWLCYGAYSKDGTPTVVASTNTGINSSLNHSEADRLEDLLRTLALETYED